MLPCRVVFTPLQARLQPSSNAAHDTLASFAEAALIEETEDFSRFSDPPAFWHPVRRDLAQALLATGDKEGAIQLSTHLRPFGSHSGPPKTRHP